MPICKFKIFYEIDGKKKIHYSTCDTARKAINDLIFQYSEETKIYPKYLQSEFGTNKEITPIIYKITASIKKQEKSFIRKLFSCKHERGGYWSGDSPGAGIYICKDCRAMLEPYSKKEIITNCYI